MVKKEDIYFQSQHQQHHADGNRYQRNAPAPHRRSDILSEYVPEYLVESRRTRRQDDDDQSSRLISSSAFSRISETLGNFLKNLTGRKTPQPITENPDLGALNTVGQYLVNMTRGQDASSASVAGSDSVPDAILTLTKNVLGQNVTKTIEPLIKRADSGSDKEASFIADKKKRKRDSNKKEHLVESYPTTADLTVSASTFVTEKTSEASSQNDVGAATQAVVPGVFQSIKVNL